MRKKIILTAATAALVVSGLAAAAPASAESKALPVRAGRDSCGNFNVWVNDSQVIYYLHCGPDTY